MNIQNVSFLFLIPLLPLIGAFINGILFWSVNNKKVNTFVAIFSVLSSFTIVLYSIWTLHSSGNSSQVFHQTLYGWIVSDFLNIEIKFVFDHLTAVMLFVILGVGSLIHIYSVGYMADDNSFKRFFTYLNLFIFFMTVLVLAGNLPVMFIGWEGVGLCSYLLIGFWYEDLNNSKAGKKAFIVNRIGDFGFVLGMIILFNFINSLDISDINKYFLMNKDSLAITVANLAGILLFIGACGKSAQIPLYVWLPDAMAGPTPVSALIHAATMVTAGIYMIARMNVLFINAEIASTLILYIGALTALFSATIATVQTDIKKILAYSTVSQLGFMFMALGSGAYDAGIFHLFTHAFFKACLFLGAGSIIHALHGEQNIFKMGGLRQKLPITYWTFLISTCAIAGFPPLSGFFSKDEIMWSIFASEKGSRIVYMMAFLTIIMTSYYMFRIIFYVFFGKENFDHDKHPHESPQVMALPLIILAFFATFAGIAGIPEVIGKYIFHTKNYFEAFLDPVFTNAPVEMHHFGDSLEFILMLLSFGAALSGFYFAKSSELKSITTIPQFFVNIKNLLFNKYYVDELYDSVIVKPLGIFSKHFLWKIVDSMIIDGFINGAAKFVRGVAILKSYLHNGNVHFYALILLFGFIGIVLYLNLLGG